MAVHRYGHFAKAAAACFVTQPTLSMQIQKLEESIGAVIFDRSKKPIILTDLGKQLIETMRSVLEEAKMIESILDRQKEGELTGNLVVGVIPTIAPYLLPRLLPVIEKKFPGISIQVHEMQTKKIVEALENDEIEVGILAIPLETPKIIEIPLYYEPFSVLCKKGHPISKLKKVNYAALKFEDIWLLEEGHCLRHQVLDVCSIKQRKTERKFQFESGSLETLKNLVNSYGGYTLLPKLATDTKGSNSEIIEFEKPVPSRQIGLVHRREHHKTQLIEALGKCALDSVPESIRRMKPEVLDVLPVD